MRVLRLGTRRSRLALAQAAGVAAALADGGGCRVELVEVTTQGDTSPEPLSRIGGSGVFVSALREALLGGRVDLAVHSLKDLPTAAATGLRLAAVPAREDPRDVLVARDGLSLGGLPPGAVVGTGSPRRAAAVQAARADLRVVAVRGNVDTRLSMVGDGRLDAVVLAMAGLARLGRSDAATEVFSPSVMCPAPGQGALAVECRADDDELVRALGPLDHPATRQAVVAERALLAALEVGCSAPVGAFADRLPDGGLRLRAMVADAAGRVHVDEAATDGAGGAGAPDCAAAARLGALLAARLLPLVTGARDGPPAAGDTLPVGHLFDLAIASARESAP